jgi:hypothetical protein
VHHPANVVVGNQWWIIGGASRFWFVELDIIKIFNLGEKTKHKTITPYQTTFWLNIIFSEKDTLEWEVKRTSGPKPSGSFLFFFSIGFEFLCCCSAKRNLWRIIWTRNLYLWRKGIE